MSITASPLHAPYTVMDAAEISWSDSHRDIYGQSWDLRMIAPLWSVSALGTRRASFFDHHPPVPVFAPTSPNNLEYLLAVSKNLAHPLHPVYDDGKDGGCKWWE